jgi:hypothetical protein
VAGGADGLGKGEAGASETVYSGGFWKEWMAYTVGVRLISEGRDFLGRLDFAHRAALSFTCLAESALKRIKQKGRNHVSYTFKKSMTVLPFFEWRIYILIIIMLHYHSRLYILYSKKLWCKCCC